MNRGTRGVLNLLRLHLDGLFESGDEVGEFLKVILRLLGGEAFHDFESLAYVYEKKRENKKEEERAKDRRRRKE